MLQLEQWKQSRLGEDFRTTWNMLQASLAPNANQLKKDELKAYQDYVRNWLWDQKYTDKTKGNK